MNEDKSFILFIIFLLFFLGVGAFIEYKLVYIKATKDFAIQIDPVVDQKIRDAYNLGRHDEHNDVTVILSGSTYNQGYKDASSLCTTLKEWGKNE